MPEKGSSANCPNSTGKGYCMPPSACRLSVQALQTMIRQGAVVPDFGMYSMHSEDYRWCESKRKVSQASTNLTPCNNLNMESFVATLPFWSCAEASGCGVCGVWEAKQSTPGPTWDGANPAVMHVHAKIHNSISCQRYCTRQHHPVQSDPAVIHTCTRSPRARASTRRNSCRESPNGKRLR